MSGIFFVRMLSKLSPQQNPDLALIFLIRRVKLCVMRVPKSLAQMIRMFVTWVRSTLVG